MVIQFLIIILIKFITLNHPQNVYADNEHTSHTRENICRRIYVKINKLDTHCGLFGHFLPNAVVINQGNYI